MQVVSGHTGAQLAVQVRHVRGLVYTYLLSILLVPVSLVGTEMYNSSEQNFLLM